MHFIFTISDLTVSTAAVYYCAMYLSAKRGIAIACRLSVRL